MGRVKKKPMFFLQLESGPDPTIGLDFLAQAQPDRHMVWWGRFFFKFCVNFCCESQISAEPGPHIGWVRSDHEFFFQVGQIRFIKSDDRP